MRTLVPAFLLLLFFAGCGSGDTSTVTFRVTVASGLTENNVFITGNDPSLGNWDPGRIKLTKINDSVWEKSFTFPTGKELEYKFTGGNWLREAADSEGRIPDNLRHEVTGDTLLTYSVQAWFNNYSSDTLVVTEKRVAEGAPELDLFWGWRFYPGDDIIWADPRSDDSKLVTASPRMNSDSAITKTWRGTGWFRMPFIIDSTLQGKEVALTVWDLGDIAIWYNGRLIYTDEENGSGRVPVVFNLKFDQTRAHLFSVRYRNSDISKFLNSRYNTGFAILLMDAGSAYQSITEKTGVTAVNRTLFSVVPAVLIMIHLFLFIFYPGQKHNLFYALSLLGFAGVVWFNYERGSAASTGELKFANIAGNISVPFATLFGQLTAWSLVKLKLPGRLWLYIAGFILLVVMN